MISAQTWIQKLKISVKTVTKLYTKALSQWTVKLIIYTVGRRGGWRGLASIYSGTVRYYCLRFRIRIIQSNATHWIVQRSTDISSIKRWIECKILPELPLQLIKIHISGNTEPVGREDWVSSFKNSDSHFLFEESRLTCPCWRFCESRGQSLVSSGCCTVWTARTDPSPPAEWEQEWPGRQCHHRFAWVSNLWVE